MTYYHVRNLTETSSSDITGAVDGPDSPAWLEREVQRQVDRVQQQIEVRSINEHLMEVRPRSWTVRVIANYSVLPDDIGLPDDFQMPPGMEGITTTDATEVEG